MKAVLGTYGLCIQGSGQPRRSHLTALVPYPYCGEEYFLVLCFLLFLNQEMHPLAGLLYPTSLLFHTTTLECPWCTINIPARELGVSGKLPMTAIKIRTGLNQNRNPFLCMCGQSISADTAKSGGTWYSPAMTCSAAKASSSQKSTFKTGAVSRPQLKKDWFLRLLQRYLACCDLEEDWRHEIELVGDYFVLRFFSSLGLLLGCAGFFVCLGFFFQFSFHILGNFISFLFKQIRSFIWYFYFMIQTFSFECVFW